MQLTWEIIRYRHLPLNCSKMAFLTCSGGRTTIKNGSFRIAGDVLGTTVETNKPWLDTTYRDNPRIHRSAVDYYGEKAVLDVRSLPVETIMMEGFFSGTTISTIVLYQHRWCCSERVKITFSTWYVGPNDHDGLTFWSYFQCVDCTWGNSRQERSEQYLHVLRVCFETSLLLTRLC